MRKARERTINSPSSTTVTPNAMKPSQSSTRIKESPPRSRGGVLGSGKQSLNWIKECFNEPLSKEASRPADSGVEKDVHELRRRLRVELVHTDELISNQDGEGLTYLAEKLLGLDILPNRYERLVSKALHV